MKPITDGDQNFIGVDMTTARDSLRPGFVASAENVRFTNGKIETRKGASYNRAYCGKGAEFDWNWPIDFTDFASFPILGHGEFMDPNGEDAILLLGATNGYVLFEDREPLAISYSGGPTYTTRIHCIQAFDAVFIFSKGMTPMRWDGDMDNISFDPVTKATGDGYQDVPATFMGISFSNRLWLPNHQDTVMASDAQEYDKFVVANEILFNKGENDEIVTLHPFNRTTLLIFKTDSVYSLSGVHGDLSDVRVDILTNHLGCVSKDAAVTVASDVHWMSESGIFSLSQVDAERNVVNGEPLSKPVQPLIDRINWEVGYKIQATLHGNRVYWAIPIDGASGCNAVLVFDVLLRTWSGIDTFASAMSFSIHSWLRADFLGKKRLFAYGDDGFCYLYEDNNIGIDDARNSGIHNISTEVKTRQYTGGVFTRKNWSNVRAELATLNPSLNLVAETVGDGETVNIFSAYTRNRLASTNFGSSVSANNADGSWSDAYREDYYVPTETTVVTLNITLDVGNYITTVTVPSDLTGFEANQVLTISQPTYGLYASTTANASGTLPASTAITITHKGVTGAEGATENSTGAPSKTLNTVDDDPAPSSLSFNLTRTYSLGTSLKLAQVQNYSFPGHLRQQDKAIGFTFTSTQGVLHLRSLAAAGIESEVIRANE